MLDSSLTNQSVCCSESIIVKSFAVEIFAYDNSERWITQGYKCIIHLTSGSKSVTLRSIDYLNEKSTRKEKQK